MTSSLTRAILVATLGLSAGVSAQQLPLLRTMIDGAKRQVGVTRSYDSGYHRIGYPNGDVPRETGVCTDVVIRAYRHAGADLQVLVHEDMKAAFSAYPKSWGMQHTDPNIDHRRVPNLATYFRRHGQTLPVTRRGADYRPGDIVTWRLLFGATHIGVVSDVPVRGTDRHLVVHNIGDGAQIEDVLFAYTVTGHYRWGR
jgi:uncharacterized protein YijF (DUF1287 family)